MLLRLAHPMHHSSLLRIMIQVCMHMLTMQMNGSDVCIWFVFAEATLNVCMCVYVNAAVVWVESRCSRIIF